MATKRRDADDFRRDLTAKRHAAASKLDAEERAEMQAARARANAAVEGISPGRFHNAPESRAFSQDERVVIENGRQAWGIIRKTFDSYVTIGRAVMLIRDKASAIGGRKTFARLLEQEDLGYFASKEGKASCSRLLRIMENLADVTDWHEGLTTKQKIEWASPASIVKRCPVFVSSKPRKAPGAKPKATEEVAELRRANADLKARVAEVQQELSLGQLAALLVERIANAEPAELGAAINKIKAALQARGPVPVKRRAKRAHGALKQIETAINKALLGED
jgi:hypothetical protein